MKKVSLLDCTLRDGGYVNNWEFGYREILGFIHKINQTGIEMIEVGFLKDEEYDRNRTVFPDINAVSSVISPKSDHMIYVAMVDMSAPIPLNRISPRTAESIDGIRVIFKKDKIEEAFEYCKKIKELGYLLFVNFVNTDLYSDKEFIDGIEKFNPLMPYAMTIVDTFGVIKKKQFSRLVSIADNNMYEGIVLCYHAHNNLQQAFSNAETLVEMNLNREVCIDACVFGMGRGAGNLNLELFADYMNENHETDYSIEPMLEIMDEYLNDIYKRNFWGYSLPLYLSAKEHCHPNYAINLAEKNTLTVKSFHEILRSLPEREKEKYQKETAEEAYRNYLENYVDDKKTIELLSNEISEKKVLLIAPGRSLLQESSRISEVYNNKDVVTIAVNFDGGRWKPDYIFSSNMRRFARISNVEKTKCIITSNMKEAKKRDYVINFSSFSLAEPEILDNSGLMALNLLCAIGTKNVLIAGMDGYSLEQRDDYIDERMEYRFAEGASKRNGLIKNKIREIENKINIQFVTKSLYEG